MIVFAYDSLKLFASALTLRAASIASASLVEEELIEPLYLYFILNLFEFVIS